MPLYEYECQDCGTRSEEIQRFSDPPLSTCRACGGRLRKLLSAPAFHLKGSGWYATDYGAKKADSSGAEPSAEGSSGDSSKKEKVSSGSAAAKGEPKGSATPAKAGT